MDTSRLIQSFNPGRFVLTSSLLIFSILFPLRIDEYIHISYWLVFLPLFLWKILVIFGACIGVFVWCKSDPSNRFFRPADNDCQELVIYFLLHLLLFVFELLACEKLENHLELLWISCFIPLLLCVFLAFTSCLWSLKVQRNFLIQAFLTLNGLFFVFLPLRLDWTITWRYSIVFIPVWISLCVALFFVIFKFIVAIVYQCSRRFPSNQRETNTITESIIYAMIFVPLSVFSILLIGRLDYHLSDHYAGKFSFTIIAIPLWMTLIAWLTLSFGATDGNPWWFGLRRDVCEILLSKYPSISLYFNNQYKFSLRPATRDPSDDFVIDLNAPTAGKSVEPSNTIKISQKGITGDKLSPLQPHSTTLMEPD